MSDLHLPVMRDTVIDRLLTDSDGFYVDATFGRGGHTEALLAKLSPKAKLLAIDQDPAAVDYAEAHFSDEPRLTVVHGSFADLETLVTQCGYGGQVCGVMADLGVSSPQLDNPLRGFSFSHDGPLDMRMDSSGGLSAADWLATASSRDIADILYRYGDERYSRRIAFKRYSRT